MNRTIRATLPYIQRRVVAVLFTALACSACGDGTNGAEAPPGPRPSGAYVEPADPVDVSRVETSVPALSLQVDAADLRKLDAAPFADEDVPGTFKDESGAVHGSVDVHYRGAYALQSLIQSGASQRNWKLKFARDQRYRARREWNLTYEPDPRQKLAYDVMHLAGVRAPSTRHITLTVNGKDQGLYLEYEDPDDKQFLEDQFGDDDGDLYKAARDIPNMPRYFATVEVLGDRDDDYFLHYDKKTNDDSTNANDFSRLRAFIRVLHDEPDSSFASWFRANFDVPKFLSYLVVTNFMSHWDGYPHRPKNFWLYEVPSAARWVFIPWDMDGTFQTQKFTLNRMGTNASIFYQFDRTESYGGHSEEGTERPLVRRAMQQAELRAAYVARYRDALNTFLAPALLLARIGALEGLVTPVLSSEDARKYSEAASDMRGFVVARHAAVAAELARQP